MKKTLSNNSLAIIILSLTLSFHSIGFAADADLSEEAIVTATAQDDDHHYQMLSFSK